MIDGGSDVAGEDAECAISPRASRLLRLEHKTNIEEAAIGIFSCAQTTTYVFTLHCNDYTLFEIRPLLLLNTLQLLFGPLPQLFRQVWLLCMPEATTTTTANWLPVV